MRYYRSTVSHRESARAAAQTSSWKRPGVAEWCLVNRAHVRITSQRERAVLAVHFLPLLYPGSLEGPHLLILLCRHQGVEGEKRREPGGGGVPPAAMTVMGTGLSQNSFSEQFRSTFVPSVLHFSTGCSPGAWPAAVGPEHCLEGISP